MSSDFPNMNIFFIINFDDFLNKSDVCPKGKKIIKLVRNSKIILAF